MIFFMILFQENKTKYWKRLQLFFLRSRCLVSFYGFRFTPGGQLFTFFIDCRENMSLGYKSFLLQFVPPWFITVH